MATILRDAGELLMDAGHELEGHAEASTPRADAAGALDGASGDAARGDGDGAGGDADGAASGQDGASGDGDDAVPPGAVVLAEADCDQKFTTGDEYGNEWTLYYAVVDLDGRPAASVASTATCNPVGGGRLWGPETNGFGSGTALSGVQPPATAATECVPSRWRTHSGKVYVNCGSSAFTDPAHTGTRSETHQEYAKARVLLTD